MSQIPVKIVTSTNYALHQLRLSSNAVDDDIRRRAYYLFLRKGCQKGHELEDWLTAERELLCFPPAELAETKDEIRIKVAVPGFDADTLQLDVLPKSITIEARAEKMTVPKDEVIHFSEFGVKRLFRQFALPTCIDPDGITATVDKGMLRIVAKKAAVEISPVNTEAKVTRTAAA
jgi:HSP20 family molecular chaperone IbpA